MVFYRARVDFETPGQKRGEKIKVKKGEIVDILNRHVADKLMSQGKIGRKKQSAFEGFKTAAPA